MKRNTEERTWELRTNRGLCVIAEREGEIVRAALEIDRTAPTLRLRVRGYSHDLAHDATASTPPLEEIERWANLPENVVSLLDQRIVNPMASTWPMILHDAKAPGKKPNQFYGMVLIYKRGCEEAGQPYAERIAKDNGVETSVVYRWVNEAKRRKITLDDDERGQIRVDGKPIDMSGKPILEPS